MFIETVVIGGGQQGCSVAVSLSQLGYEAVVLERGEIGQAWARERWDNLCVNTPNRTVAFPGRPYDGDQPESFMSAREVAARLRRYVADMGVRVREHTAVRSVETPINGPSREDARFRVYLDNDETIESRNLVAALGGYGTPRVPALASNVDPSIGQIHTRYYRNARVLPPGAILVVGAGNSGQQVAEDLCEAGRDVYLAVGRHLSAPRLYRGAHTLDWLQLMSIEGNLNLKSASDGPAHSSALPGVTVLNGKAGGRDLSLSILAAQGVTLIGSVRGARGCVLSLEDNVLAIAEAAARSERELLEAIDLAIERRGLIVPEQEPLSVVDTSSLANYGDKLDLAAKNITTIIWATGFVPDYRILPTEALDEHGAPVHRRGVGTLPGLYCAGLPEGPSVMPTLIASTRISGAFVARQIQIDNTLRHGSPTDFAHLWTS